ncbi:MAG: hypothetical protein NWF05_11440 [Candidatus Bathyarchaeota archaeon]|nr:hypothetical protein [Candidatus Bathyarchaeota archaeon]
MISEHLEGGNVQTCRDKKVTILIIIYVSALIVSSSQPLSEWFQQARAETSSGLPRVTILHPTEGEVFRNCPIFFEFNIEPPTDPQLGEHIINTITYRIDEVDRYVVYPQNSSPTPLRTYHGSCDLVGLERGIHTVRVIASYLGNGPYVEGSSPFVSFTIADHIPDGTGISLVVVAKTGGSITVQSPAINNGKEVTVASGQEQSWNVHQGASATLKAVDIAPYLVFAGWAGPIYWPDNYANPVKITVDSTKKITGFFLGDGAPNGLGVKLQSLKTGQDSLTVVFAVETSRAPYTIMSSIYGIKLYVDGMPLEGIVWTETKLDPGHIHQFTSDIPFDLLPTGNHSFFVLAKTAFHTPNPHPVDPGSPSDGSGVSDIKYFTIKPPVSPTPTEPLMSPSSQSPSSTPSETLMPPSSPSPSPAPTLKPTQSPSQTPTPTPITTASPSLAVEPTVSTTPLPPSISSPSVSLLPAASSNVPFMSQTTLVIIVVLSAFLMTAVVAVTIIERRRR